MLFSGLFLASAKTLIPIWVAAISALITLSIFVITQFMNALDRRRTIYSEAYKTAVAWEEMLFRVHRRDPEKPYELAARFHDLQEGINYYESWLDLEEPAMARSYCKLVKGLKEAHKDGINTAWEAQPRDMTKGFSLVDVEAPDCGQLKKAFLQDARDHMAWWSPMRRNAVKERNPEGP